MRTAVIVMLNPLPKNSSEVGFREGDQKINALPSNSAHDALAEAVRFWSPDWRPEYFHAERLHHLVHFFREDSITVMNDVSNKRGLREGLRGITAGSSPLWDGL